MYDQLMTRMINDKLHNNGQRVSNSLTAQGFTLGFKTSLRQHNSSAVWKHWETLWEAVQVDVSNSLLRQLTTVGAEIMDPPVSALTPSKPDGSA